VIIISYHLLYATVIIISYYLLHATVMIISYYYMLLSLLINLMMTGSFAVQRRSRGPVQRLVDQAKRTQRTHGQRRERAKVWIS